MKDVFIWNMTSKQANGIKCSVPLPYLNCLKTNREFPAKDTSWILHHSSIK